MADKTGIEWTDSTWNPIRGCSRVSEGCRHCYAETVAARFSGPGQAYEGLARRTTNGDARWTGIARLVPKALDQPIRWDRPRKIFVNSMSDIFHESLTNEEIAAVFGVMAAAPRHTFQVLTKRPQRMAEWFEWFRQETYDDKRKHVLATEAANELGDGSDEDQQEQHLRILGLYDFHYGDDLPWPLPNVWLGVSVENQAAADERIPLLLKTPAAVRFLSCEPLLESLDLSGWVIPHSPERGISIFAPIVDWVIAGGESGHGARPMHPDWARGLRDQCQAAGVPFFFKQWGEWAPTRNASETMHLDYKPGSLTGSTCVASTDRKSVGRRSYIARSHDSAQWIEQIGKKAAGSLLDGQEHKAFPREVSRG